MRVDFLNVILPLLDRPGPLLCACLFLGRHDVGMDLQWFLEGSAWTWRPRPRQSSRKVIHMM